MENNIPPLMPKAFRVTINLNGSEPRLDNVLLSALRNLEDHEDHTVLKHMSRGKLKNLFNDKKIIIKGQRAKSNSALAKGTTYVDILGY